MADARIGVTAFTIHVINDNGGDGVVYSGVGGTVDVPGLLLWGCGMGHPMYGTVCGMSCGYPDMSDGFSVNGDDIEVCGLRFCGGTGLQINGGTGISVHHNEFIGPGSDRALFVVGTTDSLNISDNLFQDWEYGMHITDGTGISISHNNITNCTRGIRSDGGNNFSIINNNIGVTGEGINLRRSDGVDLVASIIDNTITVDNTGISGGAEGINLYAHSGGDIDATVIGNSLFVTDTDDSEWVHGIDLSCSGGIIYSEIRNNSMELSTYNSDPAVTGGTCGGIELYGDYGVGGPGAGEGLAITGNTIILESESVICGIRVDTGFTVVSPIYASGAGYGIRNNTITGRTYGTWFIRGIDLGTGGGGDMYADITGNSIDVSSWDSVALTGNEAYGIFLDSQGDVFGTVSNNPLIRAEGTEAFGIYISTDGSIGSTVSPFTVIDNPGITCIGHATGGGYRVFGIRLYGYNAGEDMFARITGNTNMDLTASSGYIYGIATEGEGLIGDSSVPFATLISGNNCTLHSGASINNFGMYLRNGMPGTTNYVDLGAGSPGSVGSNTFTLLGTGATWNGSYAGGIVRTNFTIPTDRIDP